MRAQHRVALLVSHFREQLIGLLDRRAFVQQFGRLDAEAQLLREALDGKTWYELMAASEGWSDVMAWASREIPLGSTGGGE